MRKIDIATWSRRPQWEHFSKMNFPFYHVSFYIDVTQAYSYAKLHGVSFYHTICYLVSVTMNDIENFRYRIREDGVYLLDKCHPSFTVLQPGSSEFQILTCRLDGSIEEFCRHASDLWDNMCNASPNERQFIGGDSDVPEEECYFLSCLPWLDTTGMCSERTLDATDSVPRVSWGRYTRMDRGDNYIPKLKDWLGLQGQEHPVRQGKRLWINMTVDVNHRLVDGYHIGKFATLLQETIDRL